MRYFVRLKGNEAKDIGKLLKPIERDFRAKYDLNGKKRIEFFIYRNPMRITKGDEHTYRNSVLYGFTSRFAAWLERNRCDFILLVKVHKRRYKILKPPHNLIDNELSISWKMGQIGTGPEVEEQLMTMDIIDEDKNPDTLGLMVEEYLTGTEWYPLFDAWSCIESRPKSKRDFITNLAQMIGVMHREGYTYRDSFDTHAHYNKKTYEVRLVDFGMTTKDSRGWEDRFQDIKLLLDILKLRKCGQRYQRRFLKEYASFAAKNEKQEKTIGRELTNRFKTSTHLENRRGKTVEVPASKSRW